MGFERPAYFLTVKNRFEIPKYDFHGFYGHQKNKLSKYEEEISKDCNFDFYGHHEAVRNFLTELFENLKFFPTDFH